MKMSFDKRNLCVFFFNISYFDRNGFFLEFEMQSYRKLWFNTVKHRFYVFEGSDEKTNVIRD